MGPQDGRSLHFPVFLYQHWAGVGWLKLSWVAIVLKPSSLGGHWQQKVCLLMVYFPALRELFLSLFSCGSVYREGFRHICLRALVRMTFLFLIILTNCLAFWLCHQPPLAWINMRAPQIIGSTLHKIQILRLERQVPEMSIGEFTKAGNVS